MQMNKLITVVVATHNRCGDIRTLLQSLEAQTLSVDQWEVLVVDNGSTDHTQEVLARNYRLDLKTIRLSEPGKARALNEALDIATGQIIIFTDDDVIPGGRWLYSYDDAARRFPDFAGFCGPIQPVYPTSSDFGLLKHPFRSCAYSEFLPALGEEILPPRVQPFGPNFAVRRASALEIRFREDLGPSIRNGPLSCDDIDFAIRFRSVGNDFLYLPIASVLHKVRTEQLTHTWLSERAFNFGRTIVSMWAPRDRAFDVFWDPGELGTTAFDRALCLSYYLGQHFQCENRYPENGPVKSALIERIYRLTLLTEREQLGYSSRAHLNNLVS
jgi:glucosyl-dolichyl phosphate glucuronosyltransferase